MKIAKRKTVEVAKLMTQSDAAKRVGRSRQAIRQAIKNDKLEVVMVGDLPVVHVDDLEAYYGN